MLKSIRWWITGLLSTIVIIMVAMTHVYPVMPQPLISPTIATSKPELAKAVLRETGIARRYSLYLGNAIDMVIFPNMNQKFVAWLQSILRKEAGWDQVEALYVAQLVSTFSEAELNELVVMAKQPLVRKLLQAEVNAYSDSAKTRRRLFYQVWDDYNSGVFNPPPNVLR